MDIPGGSEIAESFITNVGLVTTDGPHGPNIMACEWTHHVSYRPGLIGVSVNPRHATYDNIQVTKEFGLCIASTEQRVLSSVSGRDSGKFFNKIKIAEELGFRFYPAKKIKALLVEGAAVNVECKLYQEVPLGDHTMFVGEVIESFFNPDKEPLAYHKGKYWSMNTQLEKPTDALREKVNMLFEKYKKEVSR